MAAERKRGREQLCIDFHTHILPKDLPDFKASRMILFSFSLARRTSQRDENEVTPLWNAPPSEWGFEDPQRKRSPPSRAARHPRATRYAPRAGVQRARIISARRNRTVSFGVSHPQVQSVDSGETFICLRGCAIPFAHHPRGCTCTCTYCAAHTCAPFAGQVRIRGWLDQL